MPLSPPTNHSNPEHIDVAECCASFIVSIPALLHSFLSKLIFSLLWLSLFHCFILSLAGTLHRPQIWPICFGRNFQFFSIINGNLFLLSSSASTYAILNFHLFTVFSNFYNGLSMGCSRLTPLAPMLSYTFLTQLVYIHKRLQISNLVWQIRSFASKNSKNLASSSSLNQSYSLHVDCEINWVAASKGLRQSVLLLTGQSHLRSIYK